MKKIFAALCAPLFISSAYAAPLGERQIAPNVRMIKLAENVYVFAADNTTADLVDGNSTVILTDDGVVVIDAPNPYLANTHIAEIKKLTKKPVRYVVNTHWHSDHSIGDGAYKKAFPGVQIIADEFTAEIVNRRGPALFRDLLAGAEGEKMLADFQSNAETELDDEGNPKSAYQRARDARAAKDLEKAFKSGAKAGFAGVDIAYADEMTLTLGGTKIQLRKMTGHSKGDTIAFLPKEKILIAGDLVIHPTPYGINSEFRTWPETIDALIAYGAVAVVPGHGDVQFSNDYLRLQQALVRALLKQAADAVANRRSVEQFTAEIDLEEFREKIAGDDPDRNWAWKNYFLGPALPVAFALEAGTR